ncbi:hypothetical protein [Salinarimonas chemoclinalis]|uniref:hypothetical protein n=1 Tax=Salinarimonas chemoclinalis TaxID=3241599 RepID=UPI00355799DB
MRKLLLNGVAFSALSVLAFGAPAWSVELAANVSPQSIDGAGRNIMRTADGGIVAAFAATTGGTAGLVFGRSLDNGASWSNVSLEDVSGSVVQAAIDSNFQGSYIAFTETVDGRTVGRIAFSSTPFGADPELVVSGAVTPDGVVPRDTHIQASRAGWGDRADADRETVAYGWQDETTKGLYIGVSPDGRTFPQARLVVSDPHATSGPAVAIRGQYVIATYQTTNPAIAPADVPAALRDGRTYPAWIESMDGGATWSEPKPLFGHGADAFPVASVETGDGAIVRHRLAGGSLLPNSPILNWASTRSLDGDLFEADKTLPADDLEFDELRRERLPAGMPGREGERMPRFDLSLGGTTFVQSSMRSIDGDGAEGEVSIVSFRPIEPGAAWTHVVANNALTMDRGRIDRVTSHLGAQGSQFQYSALIDTSVRATTYREVDPATGEARLVAAVSVDTGKTFDHHVSFTSEELAAHGIEGFGEGTVLAASQCLFEDRDGEVHVDVLFTQDGTMRFASLPVGVNAAVLRQREHALLSTR